MGFIDKLFGRRTTTKSTKDDSEAQANKEAELMSDYSKIVDQDGNVCDLWLARFADPDPAKNKIEISMLLAHIGAPRNLLVEVQLGLYRVVPNRFDNKGGYFVMIGSAPAPGEQ